MMIRRWLVAGLALVVLVVLVGVAIAATTPRHGLNYTSQEGINQALDKIDSRLTYGTTTAKLRLCGQQPNATTGYFGPAVTAFYGIILDPLQGDTTCDGLDSGTEATADAPIDAAFPAFRVTGMRCSISSDPTNDVVFTARSAAANLSPSLTCTVLGTGTSQVCEAHAAGVAPLVAAGATVAMKVVNTENLSAQDASCDWMIAY